MKSTVRLLSWLVGSLVVLLFVGVVGWLVGRLVGWFVVQSDPIYIESMWVSATLEPDQYVR